MARVTIEDCLENVENRFALVHLTADRVRQLQRGAARRVECNNKDIVTALREIADGAVLPQQAVREKEENVNLKIDIPDIA
jgi:DNA-directed RNA polymerase subunit omega